MDPHAIPHGPADPPMLVAFPPIIEFDIDDVDGGLFMLDRAFGGTVAVPFTKPMNPAVPGVVTLDGMPADYVLHPVDFGQVRPWMLGVKAFGRLHTYGTTHTLRIKDFLDSDGNRMLPQQLTVTTRPQQPPQAEFAEHEQVAQRVAEEGTVLLENRRNTLPLSAGQLNMFGHALHWFRTAVVGAGKINPRYVIGLQEAIRADPRFTLNEELADHYRAGSDSVPPAQMIASAKAATDVGIVVLTRAAGENADNGSGPGEFELTPDEDELISTVAASFDRSVVILNSPYPVNVDFMQRHGVDALVLAGIGGMLAGPALLRVLAGDVNPSGKLPDTWAHAYKDIPASRNFYDSAGGARHTGNADVWIDTVYEEGLYVGYRYFSTFGVDVAYPFGHGLSYTTFRITPREFLPPNASTGSLAPLRVSVHVQNTGDLPGREVAQVYLSKPDEALEQVALELVAFAKTATLAAGAGQELHFLIDDDALASWDEDAAAFVATAGEYVVRAGSSSAQTSEVGRFTLTHPVVVHQAGRRIRPVQPVTVLSRRDPAGTFPRGLHSGVKQGEAGFTPPRPDSPCGYEKSAAAAKPNGRSAVTFADVQRDPAIAAAFVDGLRVDELARLAVCGQDGWGMEGTGVAGVLSQLDGRDLPLFQVADGNSGVNVRTPNIGMPATVVLASTWDADLAREVGRVIGEEARLLDVDVILAPALNLHRNPLNGRHPEYFSEDPVLAGVLAGKYAEGLESTGVGACYKHVAANNAESSRKRNQSIIPERALRELYLRAFALALKTYQPRTIMTAYNAINGMPTAADPELIRGILREELGYQGAIMTDWSTYDTVDVVDMMLGGNNWITPGGQDDTHTRPIADAVATGLLPLDLLRENVTYLVRTVAELTR